MRDEQRTFLTDEKRSSCWELEVGWQIFECRSRWCDSNRVIPSKVELARCPFRWTKVILHGRAIGPRVGEQGRSRSFYREGRSELECFENGVEDMASEIPQLTRTVGLPAAPVEGMVHLGHVRTFFGNTLP